jgi:hypothetical protein
MNEMNEMNDKKTTSIKLPVWAAILLTAVLTASVTGLIAIVALRDNNATLPADFVDQTTSTFVEIQSTTSLVAGSTLPPPPTTIDPLQQIGSIAMSLDPNATYSVAEGDCPTAAAVLANRQLKFYQWQYPSWIEEAIDLPNNADTPISSITVDDYAPNSGQQSFLISFDGNAIGGPNFGGILAQYECRWALADMVFEDSVRTVAIALGYSPQEGLTAYSRAGVEQADLSLAYDAHQFAFFTFPLDQPLGN